MSSTKYLHGIYQIRVGEMIKQYLSQGISSSETTIWTRKGVKVPDMLGLCAEASTLELLGQKIQIMIPELLEPMPKNAHMYLKNGH